MDADQDIGRPFKFQRKPAHTVPNDLRSFCCVGHTRYAEKYYIGK